MRKNLFVIIILSGLLLLNEPMEVVASPQKTTQTRKRKTTTGKGQTSKGKGGSSSTSAKKQQGPTTSAEARQREAQAQKEIKQTEARIKENDAKVSKGLAELGKLDTEISQTQVKIKDLNTKVTRLNSEITTLENEIVANEVALERLREEYLKAVKKMRVTRKNKSALAFIFSSKSVSQAMRRMRYLREFSEWRGRQTDEINGKLTDLKNQKEALAKAREEQQSALALQRSGERELATQHSRQAALVAELKQNGQALQSHLKRKQAEAREMSNLVSQLIAQEQKKAEEERRAQEEARRKAEEERRQQELLAQQQQERESQSVPPPQSKDSKDKKDKRDKAPTDFADARKRKPRGSGSTSSEGSSSSGNGGSVSRSPAASGFQDMRGKLPYPTSGNFTVVSRFGRQYLADLPDVEYDNPGIDAQTDAGASAKAVFKGRVSGVYLLPGYNTVVIVNHGNYYTVYGNINNPSVKTGDNVEAGALLGKLAAAEDDPSHSTIHFEVWRNREKLNPQEWLK